MKEAYDIQPYDGHIIFQADGQDILLDTGSPVTLSHHPQLTLMGTRHSCRKSIVGQSLDSIVELLGRQIDTLLGLDILSHYAVEIDLNARRLTFSDTPPTDEGWATTPFRGGEMGITLPIGVNGKDVNFVLDTGAKISYLHSRYTQGLTSDESRDDFSPMIGRFHTPIFHLEATINGTRRANNSSESALAFPMAFGNLPVLLQMPLHAIGINGIIGHDLFTHFRVDIDFPSHELWLKSVKR